MNQTIADIVARRSVKRYTDQPVELSLIQEVVKTGTYAPTGMNRQSPVIIAVTRRELRDRLSRMNAAVMGTDTDPFYGAPVVLAVLASKDAPTRLYDGSLVMANMMIAAQSLGLGSCWIHRAREIFDSEEGREILRQLGVEGEYEGIGFCIVGHSAPNAVKPRSERKPDYVVWVN